MNADQLLMHVNTFHDKQYLDATLEKAEKLGINHLLLVSGDGSERLKKLEPADLGSSSATATSIELLEFIHRTYQGKFKTGVAYNSYEPAEHEIAKLEHKIEVGASFIGTQPVFGANDQLDNLKKYDIPVYMGIWLSKNINLLADCLGIQEKDVHAEDHIPMETLCKLLDIYPEYGLYISLLKYSAHWDNLKEVLKNTDQTQPAIYAAL